MAVCVLLIVAAVTFRALARSPGRRAKNRRANGSKMSSGMDPSLFTPVRTRHESNRSQLDLNDPLMQRLLHESTRSDSGSWMASSDHLDFIEAIAQGSYGRVYRADFRYQITQ